MLILEQNEIWYFMGAAVVLAHLVPVPKAIGGLASIALLGLLGWGGVYGYDHGGGWSGVLWYVGPMLISAFAALGNGLRIVERMTD